MLPEVIIAGMWDGVKVGLLTVLVVGLYSGHRRKAFLMSVLAGTFVAMLCTVAIRDVSHTMDIRYLLPSLSLYVFSLFFMASSVVLLKFPQRGLGVAEGSVGSGWWVFSALVLFVFWLPDILSRSFYLGDIIALKQNAPGVYASFITGVVVAFGFCLPVVALGARSGIAEYFGAGQLLLLFALMKLFMGGGNELTGSSLVIKVQGGMMKFIHDLVHQSFLYLLVPDHPILKITVWNFIGLLFSSEVSTFMALSVLLLPPVAFVYFRITSDIPMPEGAATGAEKRLYKKQVRASRLRHSVVVVLFILVVVLGWYSGGGDSMALYMPQPRPLIASDGQVSIPLSSPGQDLFDGRIHKFSVDLGSSTNVVLLAMKKPDGSLVLTLDACEICPPEGYGQREGYVVCIYCLTPIPTDTLGQPGGCNPVPVRFRVSDMDVRIDIEEIRVKWDAMIRTQKSAGGRE